MEYLFLRSLGFPSFILECVFAVRCVRFVLSNAVVGHIQRCSTVINLYKISFNCYRTFSSCHLDIYEEKKHFATQLKRSTQKSAGKQ